MPPRRSLLRASAALIGAVSAAAWRRAARAEGTTANLTTQATRAALLTPNKQLKWLAFYGQTASESALSAYDLVVLDPMFMGNLDQIGANGTRLCAYLSLGEVRQGTTDFERLDPACLLEENPGWPGTWRVDVRQAAWREFVLHGLLPAIMARGFTGLMLDTLDTPPWLEQVDPVANRGMRQAAVDLVQAIRIAAPDVLIIVNRSYAILPDLLPMIDAVLAESLLTMPNPDGQNFHWNTPAEVAAQLALLAPAKTITPPRPILSLDYWDPTKEADIAEIYHRQRALGHFPYVATSLLGDITPEPSG